MPASTIRRTTATALVAASLLAGCGTGGTGAGDQPGPSTQAAMAVPPPPPPPPITIRSPHRDAMVPATRRDATHILVPVRLSGTAPPQSRLVVDGHCRLRACSTETTTAADGSWSAHVRLVLSRGTPRRTVTVDYRPPAAPREGAHVSLRFREPTPISYQQPAPPPTTATSGAPEEEGDSSPAGGTSPSGGGTVFISPTTSASSGTMVMIGDSLAEGAAPLLSAALPHWSVRVNSRVGRGLAEGMRILSQTQVPPGAVLAMSLFTNDDPWRRTALRNAVHQTLDRVGPTGCAIWATIAAPPVGGLSYRKANALLNRLGQQGAQLRIVPWAEQTAAAPQLLGHDGVHPTARGNQLLAQLYAQAAESCVS